MVTTYLVMPIVLLIDFPDSPRCYAFWLRIFADVFAIANSPYGVKTSRLRLASPPELSWPSPRPTFYRKSIASSSVTR
jgi:hypothetical protein